MDSDRYNALISPDAYDYLDKTKDEDLLHDPLLEEEDVFDDDDDGVEAEEEKQKDTDDSDMYAFNSLFEEFDNETEETSEAEDKEPESPMMFSDDEDDSLSVSPEVEKIISANPFILALTKSLPSNDSIALFLKGLPRAVQDEVETTIRKAHAIWKADRHDKMFVVPSSNFSIAVLSQKYDPMIAIQRLENIGAVMVANDKKSWNALMLYYAEDAALAEVSTVTVTRESFTEWQWKTVIERGRRIKESSN